MLNEFIQSLQNKKIHVVGVSGAEGSNMLRFLVKHGLRGIYIHDYIHRSELDKNYRIWHKGLHVNERENALKQFNEDMTSCILYDAAHYLEGIDGADIIFVPQSWRLYKENKPLFRVFQKKVPFYTLTRLYLDYAPSQVIGVTGTVGKGSVCNLLVECLKKLGKKVYFAGNETWRKQVLDEIDEMTKDSYLVLEISHRQLLDPFTKAPHIAAITNIFPNHLDELSLNEYIKTKKSLFSKQSENDIAILNRGNSKVMREIVPAVKAQIYFYDVKEKKMNTNSVQKLYSYLMSIKSDQNMENIFCAVTVLDALKVNLHKIIPLIQSIPTLPARCQKVGDINGRTIVDDIKSTTPWATMSAVTRFTPNLLLICGGKTKGIDYGLFATIVLSSCREVVCLKSELSDYLQQKNIGEKLIIVDALNSAMKRALIDSKEGDTILISPAAAFFYSSFIKDNLSIKRIITFLVQEGRT